mgnify:CR=1 FL=1
MQFYELSSLFAIKDGRVSAADLTPLIEASDFLIANSSSTTSTAEAWVDSGDAAIGREIAENLLKNVSPIGAYSGWCVLSLDKAEMDCSLTFFSTEATHRIASVRAFLKHIADEDYMAALFIIEKVARRDASEGPIPFSALLDADLGDFSVNGTWFDGDDDWGYTSWSTFFDSWGYTSPESYKSWCIRMEDFQKQLLNWSKTTIDELLAFINAKV